MKELSQKFTSVSKKMTNLFSRTNETEQSSVDAFNIESGLGGTECSGRINHQDSFRNPGLYGCNRWKSTTRTRNTQMRTH